MVVRTIGFVGQGPDMYMLKLGGSEDGRHQGTAVVYNDELYFRQVPRDKVAPLVASLIELAKAHGYQPRSNGEYPTSGGPGDMGSIFRRLGAKTLIDHIAADKNLADLVEKTHPAPYQPDGCAIDPGTATA